MDNWKSVKARSYSSVIIILLEGRVLIPVWVKPFERPSKASQQSIEFFQLCKKKRNKEFCFSKTILFDKYTANKAIKISVHRPVMYRSSHWSLLCTQGIVSLMLCLIGNQWSSKLEKADLFTRSSSWLSRPLCAWGQGRRPNQGEPGCALASLVMVSPNHGKETWWEAVDCQTFFTRRPELRLDSLLGIPAALFCHYNPAPFISGVYAERSIIWEQKGEAGEHITADGLMRKDLFRLERAGVNNSKAAPLPILTSSFLLSCFNSDSFSSLFPFFPSSYFLYLTGNFLLSCHLSHFLRDSCSVLKGTFRAAQN